MTDHLPHYTLRDGLQLPVVGFGTYKLNGGRGVDAIAHAIDRGYRLLDTAFNYENEGAVGKAVQRSTIPREQVYVASKLPGRHHRYDEAIVTVQESLYRMQLDYFDLYLIHWPNPKEDLYIEAWQALIDAQRWGLVRSIGVSNFLPEHIERLEKETGVLPVINQIELHPYFNQQEQREYHKQKQILTQAWSPLGRTKMIMDEPVLQQIAQNHQRSIVQIVLRWHYQLGVLPIPKATKPERQAANLAIFDFELSETEMAKIKELSRPDGRQKNQDPAVYQEF